MLNFLHLKIAAVPLYFWSLVLAWAVLELAGWLRMRNSLRRGATRSSSHSRQSWGRKVLERWRNHYRFPGKGKGFGSLPGIR